MIKKTHESKFPIEDIPDEDSLYCRIHEVNIDKEEIDTHKKIKLIAFDPHPKGSTQMSTNWNKYSSPLDLLQLAKVPKKNGIVSFPVEAIRKYPIHYS